MSASYFLKGQQERKPAEFETPKEIEIACALPIPKDNLLTMKGVWHDGDDDESIIFCQEERPTSLYQWSFNTRKRFSQRH